MIYEVNGVPNIIATRVFTIFERMLKSGGVVGNFRGPFMYGVNDKNDYTMMFPYTKPVSVYSKPMSFERVEELLYSDPRVIIEELGLNIEKAFSDGLLRDALWECLSYIRRNSPPNKVYAYVIFGEIGSVVKPVGFILRSGYFINAENNINRNGNALWSYLKRVKDWRIEKISYYPDTGELTVHGRGKCAVVEMSRKGVYAYETLKKLILSDYCCLGYKQIVFNRMTNKYTGLEVRPKRNKKVEDDVKT